MTEHNEIGLEPLLTVEDVADILRVDETAIQNLRRKGRFAPAVTVGRQLRWTKSSIITWIQEREEGR